MKTISLLALLIALSSAIGTAPNRLDRDLKRSLSPRAQFQNYPFATLIMATSSDGIVEYVCTGSILNKDNFAHILTTAYCIQDRNDANGQPVTYTALVEDPQGSINLGVHNFTLYGIRQRFFHPNASDSANFRFVSQWPNGTTIGFSVAVSPFDLGILKLNTSIDVAGAGVVSIGTFLPGAGGFVSFVGYGGPQFFTLGATSGTRLIQSFEVVANQDKPNTKIIFLHDVRDQIEANQTQAGKPYFNFNANLVLVEPGDEGSPILDSAQKLIGVVQGSWQINTNETGLITFATLGTALPDNLDWIRSVVEIKNSPVDPSDGTFYVPQLSLLLLAFLAVV